MQRLALARRDLAYTFIGQIPGALGNRLRYRFWKARLAHLGRDVQIDVGAWFSGPEHVRVGDHAWIDRNTLIIAGPPTPGRATARKVDAAHPVAEGQVDVGDNVHIAPNVVISGIGGVRIGANTTIATGSAVYSYTHHYRNLVDRDDPKQYSFTSRARPDQQSMLSAPVWIGEHCAVGLGCVVLPGSVLQDGAWLASGTVFAGVAQPQSVTRPDVAHLVKDLSHLQLHR